MTVGSSSRGAFVGPAKIRGARALGYLVAGAVMLALIGLVLLVSKILIIPNAGVLYLLAVIASALWLGTGPAVLAIVFAVLGIAYFYVPLDANLGTTATRLMVITPALIVSAAIARRAAGERVSALRLAEEADAQRKRFQTVVECAPAGIAVLRGSHFRFELVNPAYQAIASGKSFTGRTVAEVWPELADRVLPLLEGVQRTGVPYHAVDTPLPIQRGPGEPITEQYFTFSYIPMRDVPGWSDAILVLVAETTEHVLARKRIDADRERAEELAGRAEELAAEREDHLERMRELDLLKDDFLSTAAHELKTPLTSLRGFAQILLRQQESGGIVDPERLAHCLQVIDRQSQKLARIVNQLLDVSGIEGRQLRLERQQVDLVPIVEGVVVAARLQAAEVLIHVTAPARAEIFVDPLRVEQVVANLVDNALRYSPEGAPIEVALATNSHGAEIVVRDHGIGIPPDKRAHLFQRFYRAHPGGHIAGLGLGLFVSSQIVTLHGGRIAVDFPPDGGTRFIVTLPVGEDGAGEPQRKETD